MLAPRADVDVTSISILFQPCIKDDEHIVATPLEYGYIADDDGHTAITLAKQKGHRIMVQMLEHAEKKPYLKIIYSDNKSPLLNSKYFAVFHFLLLWLCIRMVCPLIVFGHSLHVLSPGRIEGRLALRAVTLYWFRCS